MIFKLTFCIFTLLLVSSCNSKKTAAFLPAYKVKLDTLTLYDTSRNRTIPVAFYRPDLKNKISNQQIVIFSHGYGQNKGGDYLHYSYLTENLASKGYFVVSIQHELPTDDLIPTDGKPQIVRMPFWERGVDNILFVVNELKKTKPELDYQHLTLIGHSNGGDMIALLATKYPEKVYKIITLDHRRMYLPKTSAPKIYTLRSNDFPADEGVLPDSNEQKKYSIVVQPTQINHGKMDDKASPEEKKTLNFFIWNFIKELKP
ncbi:alpha/beta hydrolase family protein [Chryseobacterium defluvii]|uniref:Chlorophyllase-like protein n=1 Tax=Chryseobacterium defluvii TaxID=160396 RepID=A0A495SCU8_9FLAO|nr:alpha/beta fold hydrolase [Chryseobacterium defluvii]RKS98062.1 chlorophyllase-like protein [Chryseobacterium defluvii]